ncbi:MAG: hypothetical protein BWY93_01842 [Euryarchaeota archaeon ADurb.BinA087]|nr:MAG: hypothetical protein BWY93_02255 [Euryarchaeota archaeon ADurb.BinA087]OPZ42428.1 MAG: hypothetical protein BWY93_01842 [Euryarchaeota archaeon ADurb.BinA087]
MQGSPEGRSSAFDSSVISSTSRYRSSQSRVLLSIIFSSLFFSAFRHRYWGCDKVTSMERKKKSSGTWRVWLSWMRTRELGTTSPVSYLEIAIALIPISFPSCRWLSPALIRASLTRSPMLTCCAIGTKFTDTL